MTHAHVSPTLAAVCDTLRQTLSGHAQIRLAILFGSMARQTVTLDSDVDVAIATHLPLTPELHLAIGDDLALVCNRPIDLLDLNTVGEPMLGHILNHGIRILGSASAYGDILFKHVMDCTDFLPYRQRILRRRRELWMKP